MLWEIDLRGLREETGTSWVATTGQEMRTGSDLDDRNRVELIVFFLGMFNLKYLLRN